MFADLRYIARSLSRLPAFTLLVIATLAIGIGANTAMFSVVNAVLLAPFPYPDADALMRLEAGTSYPDLEDLSAQSRSVTGFAGFRAQMFDYASGDAAERIDGAVVTGGMLPLLGARAVSGRLIEQEDDRVGASRVVVVSSAFWRTRLAASPAVVGSSLSLSGETYTVVGVLEPEFSLPAMHADIIAPFAPLVGRERTARGAHTLRAFGRLAPGVTREAAQQELDAIAARLRREYPATNTDVDFPLLRLREHVGSGVRQPLLMLLATVAFVLLIACVNVANLLFARVSARRSELAVRAAIGATRGRLMRQLLLESLVLAGAGGALGLAVAWWLTQTIVALAPAEVPRLEGVAMDGRVLLYATLISIATGLLFGTLPAWSSASASLADAARAGTRGSRAGNRVRSILLVAEIALACVLLVGAGLLLRSFAGLIAQPPGFETANLLTGNVTLNGPRYATPVSRARFWEQVEERFRALPGVEEVALTSDLPIGGAAVFHNLAFEGKPVAPGTEPEVYYRSINDAFFRAMRIPLLKGRLFNSSDREAGPLVAVVNETFARQYYPGEEVLGKRIRWAAGVGNWITIVGVVADVRGLSLDLAEVPAVHMPLAQEQNSWRRWIDIAVRTNGDQAALAPMLRREIARVDRHVPIVRIRAMDDVIAASVADRRFSLVLLGGFALISLLLAAAGTYGVMANLVAQRRREVGVRMALGASPADVFRLIVGRGMSLAAAGVGAGLVAAALLTRVIETMLFGVGRLDAPTFVAVVGILLAAAAAASYWPARRAASTDPLVALRSE